MTPRVSIFLYAAAAALAALPAQASMNISSAPTKNVICSGGVCSPTAKGAILNVADLQNLLATSDVTVNTGAGAVTIEITAPLSWASSHQLTLNADFNISIKAPVAVEGTTIFIIAYNKAGQGGQLQFFPGGRIDFWDTSSMLMLNGRSYTLVNDLPTLASDISSIPDGGFALAKDYNAAQDGIYQDNAVKASFGGTLEGLGHTVSNLSIQGATSASAGLFAPTNGTAVIRDLILSKVNILDSDGLAGAFMGTTGGGVDFFGVSSSGTIKGARYAGGIVGQMNGGNITASHSSAVINTGGSGAAGGLVGIGTEAPTIVLSSFSGRIVSGPKSVAGGLTGILESGQIVQSFSTGSVDTKGSVEIGGLAGAIANQGSVTDSYSMGEVTAHHFSTEGGLIGYDDGAVSTSYSTTQVNYSQDARKKIRIGGFAGQYIGGTLASDYWDIDTSLQSEPCANPCHAVTGLSDAALKSGLPAGFDPTIWAQSPSINAGYPYLIANPPQ